FITQGLEEKGHSVVSAGDGEAGLILADSQGFSVFILDIGLPGRLDGFDVAQRLRSKHRNVPIMMLTARDATEDSTAALTITSRSRSIFWSLKPGCVRWREGRIPAKPVSFGSVLSSSIPCAAPCSATAYRSPSHGSSSAS
ncbi:MAG: response regulator, partial [Gemmatimonadetes bacterium]|nr:response regulator [Gemmatimonadota bacterium]